MSTAKDNVQNNGAIDMGDGITATPNPDGTYTITGDPEINGVYAPAEPDTPGAFQVEDTGTQFDGQWWVKQ